jgi:hypothetical protein
MNAREFLLSELLNFCREEPLEAEWGGFTWQDTQFIRTAIVRIQRLDDSVWDEFTQSLTERPKLACFVRKLLEHWGYLYHDCEKDQLIPGLFPPEITKMSACDAEALIESLAANVVLGIAANQPRRSKQNARSRIMYIECKTEPNDRGRARIGRVTFSATGKTIYYRNKAFQSYKGGGIGANYFEVQTGDPYWISGPKKNG